MPSYLSPPVARAWLCVDDDAMESGDTVTLPRDLVRAIRADLLLGSMELEDNSEQETYGTAWRMRSARERLLRYLPPVG